MSCNVQEDVGGYWASCVAELVWAAPPKVTPRMATTAATTAGNRRECNGFLDMAPIPFWLDQLHGMADLSFRHRCTAQLASSMSGLYSQCSATLHFLNTFVTPLMVTCVKGGARSRSAAGRAGERHSQW